MYFAISLWYTWKTCNYYNAANRYIMLIPGEIGFLQQSACSYCILCCILNLFRMKDQIETRKKNNFELYYTIFISFIFNNSLYLYTFDILRFFSFIFFLLELKYFWNNHLSEDRKTWIVRHFFGYLSLLKSASMFLCTCLCTCKYVLFKQKWK